MQYIELTKGKRAIVDDEDYNRVNQYKWHVIYKRFALNKHITFFATRTTKEHYNLSMHRFILNIPKGINVNHINHITLDNRKSNLRVCTQQQSMFNQKLQVDCSSRFKGVCWEKRRGKWKAQIQKNKKSIFIGRFLTEEEAALAYNNKASELFGNFAFLNDVKGELNVPITNEARVKISS